MKQKNFASYFSINTTEEFSPEYMLGQPFSYYLPYIYAVGNNICFILAQFIAKIQTDVVSPMFVIYFRSLILLIINSLLIYNYNRIMSQSPQKPYQNSLYRIEQGQNTQQIDQTHINTQFLIRIDIMDQSTFVSMTKYVILTCLSIAFYTMALKHAELSITNALFETGPIFIPILKVHLYLTILSFLGVAFIILPEVIGRKEDTSQNYQSSDSIVYLLPLFASFTSACSISYFNEIKKKVHPLLTFQYLMLGALTISGILFNFQQGPIIRQIPENTLSKTTHPAIFTSIFSPLFILSTILMSFFIFTSKYFSMKSQLSLSSSKVAPLHYFGIILSIFLDLVVFGSKIKWYQYIEMTLASSGLLMKFLTRNIENGQAKSSSSESSKF